MISPRLRSAECGAQTAAASLDLHRTAIGGVSIYSRAAPRSQLDPKELGRDRFTYVSDEIAVQSEAKLCVTIVVAQTVARCKKVPNLIGKVEGALAQRCFFFEP